MTVPHAMSGKQLKTGWSGKFKRVVKIWVNSNYGSVPQQSEQDVKSADSADWLRVLPLIFLHIAAVLGVLIAGWSPIAVLIAGASYFLRMFSITAFYHRYFSHKSYKVGRATQFIFALLGATATQRGPLWWAAHHRDHHRHSDTDKDPHNSNRGFWWSHMGWFLSRKYHRTQLDKVSDLATYPELVWLDRHELIVPLCYALIIYLTGLYLEYNYPELGASALQVLVWGYFVSTIILLHMTLCINSLSHRWGRRRYGTRDNSRNNLLLALLTLGEGWHNNHHYYPGSARQGFKWWQIDISYYVLFVMSKVGLVKNMKELPQQLR